MGDLCWSSQPVPGVGDFGEETMCVMCVRRKAESFEVFCNTQNDVVIVRRDPYAEEENHIIVIHPDQVEMLCDWLRSAETEAREYSAEEKGEESTRKANPEMVS